jgi:hypothetical protein
MEIPRRIGRVALRQSHRAVLDRAGVAAGLSHLVGARHRADEGAVMAAETDRRWMMATARADRESCDR